MRTRWIHELKWPEVEDHLRRSDVALIPIGATEQHGRHLPMLVDTGWAIAASEAAAEAADVLIAPPVHFGWSPHHMGYAGTITLSAATLTRLTVDIGMSLVYHGFSRLVIVNGNRIANLSPLEIAAVEIANRTGAFVGIADVGLIAKRDVAALARSGEDAFAHAGEIESAFALHWAGTHVDMDQAPRRPAGSGPKPQFDFVMELDPALNGNAVNYAIRPEDYRASTAPDGINVDVGRPTEDQGAALVETIGRRLAEFVEEVRKRPTGPLSRSLPV